jgi:hypothetical protein
MLAIFVRYEPRIGGKIVGGEIEVSSKGEKVIAMRAGLPVALE